MNRIGNFIPIVKRVMYFIIGNLLYALALRLFFVDNNIVAGGFTGIATVINYLIPISIGSVVFILNIPFLIIAFFVKGWKFTVTTTISTLVFSVILNFLGFLPTVTDNLLLASICGGVIYGVGAVAILKADASVGGTDLVARLLLLKFRNLSLGKMFLIVDGITIVFAMIIFKNVELGLYAIIALYTCAVFTDKFITGFNYASICYIITKVSPEFMSDNIMKNLSRGVTCQKAIGMYELTEKNILMVVVKPKEMYKLKDIIKKYDPTAFVVVAYANEVQGGGFQEEKGKYNLIPYAKTGVS